jgi:hypothetical protein
MKEAFNIYFNKLNVYADEMLGTKPLVSYSEELNKQLIVSEPDEDGEVEWQPQLQTEPFDFDAIEASLGYRLSAEIKEFYGTYFFFSLRGLIDGIRLYFYPVSSKEVVERVLLGAHRDGQYYYPKSEILLIGNAIIEEDDSYLIFYDNSQQKIFFYEDDTKQKVESSRSLFEILENMEARI